MELVIFDCDGVLVNTEYLKFLGWKEALKTGGIPFSVQEYMPLVGHSSKNILQMIRDAKNVYATARVEMVAIAIPNQFTLTHDFVNAERIISSYEEFASFDVLTRISGKQ